MQRCIMYCCGRIRFIPRRRRRPPGNGIRRRRRTRYEIYRAPSRYKCIVAWGSASDSYPVATIRLIIYANPPKRATARLPHFLSLDTPRYAHPYPITIGCCGGAHLREKDGSVVGTNDGKNKK